MRARHALSLAMLFLLAGCQQIFRPATSAYRHFGDRLKIQLGMFGAPCGGWSPLLDPDGTPLGECFAFGAPKRMTGVLQISTLAPTFIIAGATTAGQSAPGEPIAAVSDRYQLMSRPVAERGSDGAIVYVDRAMQDADYLVSFIGRETPTGDGQGVSGVVIVDRIDSIRRLPQTGS